MTNILPKGRVLTLEAKIVLPESAGVEDIEDWIHSVLFQEGGISPSNPLYDSGVNSIDVQWDDTETYQSIKIDNIRKIENGFSYSKWPSYPHDDRGPEEIDGWREEYDIVQSAIAKATQ